MCLIGDVGRHLRLSAEIDAARVDEAKALAVPLNVDILAIAGDAGLRMHDGVTTPGEPIAQRRLADVRVSDDGDDTEQRQVDRAAVLRHLVVELAPSLLARPWWLSTTHAVS